MRDSGQLVGWRVRSFQGYRSGFLSRAVPVSVHCNPCQDGFQSFRDSVLDGRESRADIYGPGDIEPTMK